MGDAHVRSDNLRVNKLAENSSPIILTKTVVGLGDLWFLVPVLAVVCAMLGLVVIANWHREGNQKARDSNTNAPLDFAQMSGEELAGIIYGISMSSGNPPDAPVISER
jgi:hypothetical protein